MQTWKASNFEVKNTHLVVDWPLPRSRGDLTFLWLQVRIALEHDQMRFDELLEERWCVHVEAHVRQLVEQIVLHVPDGVLVQNVRIAGHLDLLVRPFGQLFGVRVQRTLCEVVNELQFASDRSDRLVRLTVHHEHLPDVVRIAHSVLAVAGHLVVLLGQRGALLVRVQIASGHCVLQPNEVTVAHDHRLIFQVHLLVELFDHPPVVAVLVRVGGHLLLTGADALRVEMPMGMQVAAADVVVL